MKSRVEINRHCAYKGVYIKCLSHLGGILTLVFMSHLEGQVYREIPQLASDTQHFSISWM